MDDVLNDALSNLEHDNYERSHKGYENRQADIALIRAALAAQPAASAEPVAWAAVHFGGRRDGNIYTTCDTREQIEAYIQDVHRSSDSLTLRARPLAFADAPVAAQPKRRPYNTSGSLSEYGVFPECDAAPAASAEPVGYVSAALLKVFRDKSAEPGVDLHIENIPMANRIPGKSDAVPIYTNALAAHKPAAFDIEAAAKALADAMDYPWEHMPDQGRENMRKNARKVLDAAAQQRQGEGGEGCA